MLVPTEGNSGYPGVAEFFAGKTVAVTGATGSLGQGVIEKLLRCCPNVKKIILFIRKKKNAEPEERFEQFLKLPVFDVLREMFSNFSDKLTFVSCNLEVEGLGLDFASKLLLRNETDIFIHSAATLRFNEHLRTSYLINVQCVRRIIKLCKEMNNLKALAHISTAYSHCDRKTINEELYDCGIDYMDLDSALRCMDDDAITKVTSHILGKRPNTYTLTKALAEDVIARESGNLPVCIVRPSMIIPAWQDPMPGWCTNIYGPTAFFVAYATGVLRSVIADEKIVADLIPVDLVVSGVICATMKTACDFVDKRHSPADEYHKTTDVAFTEEEAGTEEAIISIKRCVPMYHLTTGALNPLYIHDLVRYGKQWYHHYPLDPHRLPGLSITCNRKLHSVTSLLQQTIPAYFDDVLLTLTNQKRRMREINEKLMAGMHVMEYFFTHEWSWSGKKTQNLKEILTPQDQKTFNFDPSSFTWEDHIRHYVMGTRKYVVKQDMGAYPDARKKVESLKIRNRFVNSFVALGLVAIATTTGFLGCAWDLMTSATQQTLSLFYNDDVIISDVIE